MIYITLSGIARHVMKDLLSNRIRTLEIRSPNNFFALIHVHPGDRIFVTEASTQDIVGGTTGLITNIKEIQLITHKVFQSIDHYYEEREVQAARTQLQLIAIGRVRKIESFELDSPLRLEVDEVRYCNAR
ncbi:MAG: DUF473 domain-containing protein [Methanotrichaceae archaeon]|nr:DUF473 domain-containing protein [Methanotrichaceae archaeon]